MALAPKTVRAQLTLLKPFLAGSSLKAIRKGQNTIGEMMEAQYRQEVVIRSHAFDLFEGAWVVPKDERRRGVILYLHGGGYTCGDLEYATGFGAALAAQTGMRTFCIAYRLAPEHPFPAALEDAVTAYRYLLGKGYQPENIALCGESAGGGLCYSLCMALEQEELPLPGGIVAISPWTDLTASGASYQEKQQVDPMMSAGLLDFFANCYTRDRKDPLVSPLFGDLGRMPPSLIFVGEDEIMRDDAVQMHQALRAADRRSELVVTPERWHGYILYGFQEDKKDFDRMNRFLDRNIAKAYKLRWLRLDNAAKIYPAALRSDWSNVFRISATLTEPVDEAVLQSALDVTARRFPSIAVRLRRGVFWYYLQQLSRAPLIQSESSYPLTPMSRNDLRRCAFRVIAYENRIAVEFFHSLTDGNGALIFVKSLVAEYLQQKYGLRIPAEHGVLGRLEEPTEAELEDSFLKHAATINASRKENTAWHLRGTREPDDFKHLTCLQLPVDAVMEKAKQYGVTATVFMTAAMMLALQNLQKEMVPDVRRRKPIKVLIPVNLRRLFPSTTMRNFAMYTTPELLPQLGDYSFEEICKVIRAKMDAEINPKQMSMKIATNVSSERLLVVRILPLFVKNLVMKAIFNAVGETKSCLSMSNLGLVKLPQEMEAYVQRMDFILGVQATAPYNCGLLSYGGTMYVNFIRNIRQSRLEYHFHRVLQELGLTATVESNERR